MLRAAKFKALVAKRMEAARPIMEEMARLGYGGEDIGPKIGRTPATARHYMRALGIKFQTNGRKVFRYDRKMLADKILPRFKAGVHPRLIAMQIKVSEATVRRFLGNNGHYSVREHGLRR